MDGEEQVYDPWESVADAATEGLNVESLSNPESVRLLLVFLRTRNTEVREQGRRLSDLAEANRKLGEDCANLRTELAVATSRSDNRAVIKWVEIIFSAMVGAAATWLNSNPAHWLAWIMLSFSLAAVVTLAIRFNKGR